MLLLGACFESKGDLAAAGERYQRFLDRGGKKTPAKLRKAVLRKIADLRARPSRLTVQTSPAGARLLIAAEKPTPAEFELAPGRHIVRVEMEGYQPREAEVEASAGRPVDLALDLLPAPEPARVVVPRSTGETTKRIDVQATREGGILGVQSDF